MTFRDVGLAIVRAVPSLEGLARRLYTCLPDAFHDTPAKRLRAFFAGESDVAFVQIGAYDGVAGDPVRPILLDSPGWRGVLVEPQPGPYARLIQNYAHQTDRLVFLNAAISTSRGERLLFRIEDADVERLALPEWAGEIASFDESHLTRHLPHANITQICVKTLLFEDVASNFPDGRVDAVIMDVEGHERPILENIEFDRHRVRFVLFEHKHMNVSEKSLVADLLGRRGFALKEHGRDTVAWRKSAAA